MKKKDFLKEIINITKTNHKNYNFPNYQGFYDFFEKDVELRCLSEKDIALNEDPIGLNGTQPDSLFYVGIEELKSIYFWKYESVSKIEYLGDLNWSLSIQQMTYSLNDDYYDGDDEFTYLIPHVTLYDDLNKLKERGVSKSFEFIVSKNVEPKENLYEEWHLFYFKLNEDKYDGTHRFVIGLKYVETVQEGVRPSKIGLICGSDNEIDPIDDEEYNEETTKKILTSIYGEKKALEMMTEKRLEFERKR